MLSLRHVLLGGCCASSRRIARQPPTLVRLAAVGRGCSGGVASSSGGVGARWHPLVAHLSSPQRRAVGLWLATCAGMTAGAVVLGGLTRLTRSGLSMTNWSLFKELPPMGEAAWAREFERYQAFPEYEYIVRERGSMTLADFKAIYWLEYLHRTWGRAIGVAFAVPAVYFWARGRFKPDMQKRVAIYGTLLLGQGLLGWYMVRSGLSKDTLTQDVPRVSQYRLAAHLGSALVLFSMLTWSALTHLLPVTPAAAPIKALAVSTHLVTTLVFTTALSGAFVAGIDAGLVYNSWPKMADRWFPSDYWALRPAWRNLFENPSATQFNHRLLGHTAACLVAGLWLLARRSPLPQRTQLAVNCLLGAVLAQAGLGIATLLAYVPVALAACHQAGSVALLGTATWLMHELRRLPK